MRATTLANGVTGLHTAAMGNLHDLFLLVLLGSAITIWLKLSRARELAAMEARRHCERYGLQLLDETVGLRAVRLRRIDGRRVLERSYGFDVSIDGDDRESGHLWMSDRVVTELNLPTMRWLSERTTTVADSHPAESGNVIPLRPRLQDDRSRH